MNSGAFRQATAAGLGTSGGGQQIPSEQFRGGGVLTGTGVGVGWGGTRPGVTGGGEVLWPVFCGGAVVARFSVLVGAGVIARTGEGGAELVGR